MAHERTKAILTTLKIKHLPQGRHTDGDGLTLFVDANGNRRWVLRVQIKGGRRVDMGLGSFKDFPLTEARDAAREYRQLAKKGIDPVQHRKNELNKGVTFKEAALALHTRIKGGWKSDVHREQWLSSLERFAFPKIGHIPVTDITKANIHAVLDKIWWETHQTAVRVAQRIKAVIDAADGDTDVVRKVTTSYGKAKKKPTNLPALDYQQLPGFIEALQKSKGWPPVRLALEWTILTAARAGETFGAKWSEIDGGTWRIPQERMKAGEAHAVPLSPRCLEILVEAKVYSPGEYIFPPQFTDQPLHRNRLLRLLRKFYPAVDEGAPTVHGFRAAFSTWAAEETAYPFAVIELALAHVVGSTSALAYRRTKLEDKRRDLMDAWASYVNHGANVVSLKVSRA